VATLSPDGSPLTGPALAGSARTAERLGFDSLWFFDGMSRGFILPDPLIGVSVAAAVTSRVEVGTCILQVPLRNPVELAHRILTAHLVAGGRLLLGVGAGSTRADFDALGLDFAGRLQAFEAALPVMRRLWRGEKVGSADLTPWPAALGGPPVLIGSWGGPRWIPRVRRLDRLRGPDRSQHPDRGHPALPGRRRQARDRDEHRGGPLGPDGSLSRRRPLPPPLRPRHRRAAAPDAAGPRVRRRGAGRQGRVGGEPGRRARPPAVAQRRMTDSA
jgi:hypothetical protein